MSKIDPMILRVRDVVKNYGGLCAVAGASLDVPRRTTIALVGPNGCGKTSLLNTIFGLQRADEGNIYFEGESIDELPPNQVFARGIVHAFQFPRLFNQLSVLDNMLIAARGNRGDRLAGSLFSRRKWHEQEEAMLQKATDTLELMDLTRLTNEPAGSLSGGQKKLLEIGRVLMARPKLILLDEPVAGVNPSLTREIADHLRALVDDGLSVLLIEHHMDTIAQLCDHVVVLAEGRNLAEGSFDALSRNEAVQEAYMGRRQPRVRQ